MERGQPRLPVEDVMNRATRDETRPLTAAASARTDSLRALLRGIVHDLSNLLAPILLSYGELEVRLTAEEDREILEALGSAADAGQRLTRQLQWVGQGLDGGFIYFKIQHLLKGLEATVRSALGSGVRVSTSLPGDLQPLHGDPGEIFLALLILCGEVYAQLAGGATLSIEVIRATARGAGNGHGHGSDPHFPATALAVAGRPARSAVAGDAEGATPGGALRASRNGQLEWVQAVACRHGGFLEARSAAPGHVELRLLLPAHNADFPPIQIP